MPYPIRGRQVKAVGTLSAPPVRALYIFGYGSLIEDESRERTTPSAVVAWPARVKGVRRGWWDRADSGLTTTFLGAVLDPEATCNGVIYQVSPGGLQDTDARETGYIRYEIPRAAITMLDGCADVPDGRYYLYLNSFPVREIQRHLPTAEFPIVQSYVDLCVHGCLEVEARYRTAKGFTDEFFATSYGWNKYWVNDRLYPRRAFGALPQTTAIDTALQTHPQTAELFYQVELEPARWEDRRPVRPRKNRKTRAKP